MEIALRDLLYILVLAIGVAGSHFVLRAKVMVLEERSRNHGHQFDQIMMAIERLEKKLERKADR
tara:strand:- start:598 stop:789 length:192 start_codon:yes stop_codon:yes gene_type:complete